MSVSLQYVHSLDAVALTFTRLPVKSGIGCQPRKYVDLAAAENMEQIDLVSRNAIRAVAREKSNAVSHCLDLCLGVSASFYCMYTGRVFGSHDGLLAPKVEMAIAPKKTFVFFRNFLLPLRTLVV